MRQCEIARNAAQHHAETLDRRLRQFLVPIGAASPYVAVVERVSIASVFTAERGVDVGNPRT